MAVINPENFPLSIPNRLSMINVSAVASRLGSVASEVVVFIPTQLSEAFARCRRVLHIRWRTAAMLDISSRTRR